VGRRRRNPPVILTNRHCEKRVEARDKLYDRKATGLYISRTASGMTTFNFQIWNRFTGKVCGMKIGVYNPKTFNVDHARAAVYALRARIGHGENIFETTRHHKTIGKKQGGTVAELIELRIAWMKTLEKKADGEMRPRIETWSNVASQLHRLVSP